MFRFAPIRWGAFFLLSVCVGVYTAALREYSAPHWSSALPYIAVWVVLIVIAGLPLYLYVTTAARSRVRSLIGASVLMLYYAGNAVLIAYFLSTRLYFDFYYFWHNRNEVYETVVTSYPAAPWALLGGLVALVCCAFALHGVRVHSGRQYRRKSIIGALVVLCGLVVMFSPGVPLVEFGRRALATYTVVHSTVYQKYYEDSLRGEALQAAAAQLEERANMESQAAFPPVIMVQLESLNSEFISSTITPQLYTLARGGVLLRKHHSNGVQTRRAMESILCGALPSVSTSSYRDKVPLQTIQDASVTCLPHVMRAAGYKTILFQNYDLSFQDVDILAALSGFDEAHGDGIMRPGDPRLLWGYREDIFFQRVAEYLKNQHVDQPLFVYLIVGASNHFPFEISPNAVPQEIREALPIQEPHTYRDNRINAAYIQDAYLAHFTHHFGILDLFDPAHLFIFGDHPVGIYRENQSLSFNVEGVENNHFHTGLLYRPPHSDPTLPARVVSEDRGTSHRLIAPTIAALLGGSLGLESPAASKAASLDTFLDVLRSPVTASTHCAVDVQPFFNVAIGMVEFPHKIVLDLTGQKILYTDLRASDASGKEKRIVLHESLDSAAAFIEACLANELAYEVKTVTSALRLAR